MGASVSAPATAAARNMEREETLDMATFLSGGVEGCLHDKSSARQENLQKALSVSRITSSESCTSENAPVVFCGQSAAGKHETALPTDLTAAPVTVGRRAGTKAAGGWSKGMNTRWVRKSRWMSGGGAVTTASARASLASVPRLVRKPGQMCLSPGEIKVIPCLDRRGLKRCGRRG